MRLLLTVFLSILCLNMFGQFQYYSDWYTEKVAVGYMHTLFLKNGEILGWGNNQSGQIGTGDTTSIITPTETGNGNNWRMLASGYEHSLAIKADGTLWAWGDNTYGQLGDSTFSNSWQPKQIDQNQDWYKVFAGKQHSIALKIDGTIWSWGRNNFNQLGYTSADSSSIPQQIGNMRAKAIATYGNHTLALLANGEVWGWGNNEYNQITDSLVPSVSTPIKITLNTSCRSIAAGENQSFAILSNGTLWGWGFNDYGQIGTGDTLPVTIPTKITNDKNWLQLSSGTSHTLGKKADGTLWGWGDNDFQQIDGALFTHPLSPIQLYSDSFYVNGFAGDDFSLAIKANGEVLSWGKNDANQLGIGGSSSSASPTTFLENKNEWLKMVKGRDFTAGIQSNGTIQVTGLVGPYYGFTPIPINNDSDWVDVFVGINYVFALKSNGFMYAFGANNNGQLGVGYTSNPGPPFAKLADSIGNWLSAAGGSLHSAGVKADGTLYTWGWNYNGSLGYGSLSSVREPTPTKRGLDSTWIALDIGSVTTLLIKGNGDLWGFGEGDNGQLARGSALNSSLPVKANGANWIDIDFNDESVFGKQVDGNVFAWGFNGSGELGIGSLANQLSPTALINQDGWYDVSGGQGSSSGISNKGQLYTWGSSTAGALGLGVGVTTNQTTPQIIVGYVDQVQTCNGSTHANTIHANREGYCATGRNFWHHLGLGSDTNVYRFACGGDLIALSINRQPNDTAGCIGSSAYFNIESQNPLSFNWQVSNDSGLTWNTPTSSNFRGVNSDTLFVDTLKANSVLALRCIVTGLRDNDTSQVAFLSPFPSPIFNIAGNDTTCSGDTIFLTGGSNGSYQWGSAGILTNYSTVISTSQNLSVVLTDSNSCSLDTTILLVANPLPGIGITGPNSICEGDSLILQAVGADVYEWFDGTQGSLIRLKPSGSQNYRVTGINSTTGCSNEATRFVTLNPSPDTTTSIFNGTMSSSTSGFSYKWVDCGTNSIIQGETNRTFQPVESGFYAVIVTDGSCADTSRCRFVEVPDNSIKEAHLSKIMIKSDKNSLKIYNFPKGRVGVELINVNGQLVRSYVTSNRQELIINTTELVSGIYLLKINSTHDFRQEKVFILSR